MPRLSIKNIGPIKEVDIILNKINLIIGPQSSGKSTINKIACYCTWVEKTVSLAQSFEFFMKDNSFLDNLVNFHKLKGYFREDSYIEYESNVVRFSYLYSENLPHFEWIDKYGYIRPKISYIPAERNIVSMISDWGQVNLPNNNIFNFMSDWNVARKLYTYDHNLPIDYIGAKYFYDENSDMDFLETEDGNRIQLINASSGQQSLTPLFVLIKYFTEEIYDKKQTKRKVRDGEREMKLISQLFYHSLAGIVDNKSVPNDDIKIQQFLYKTLADIDTKLSSDKREKFIKEIAASFFHFLEVNYTSLFIEEPELNLFPSTQRELLYFLINTMNANNHRLFMTTHSPYILYALNNCMMGWLVKDRLPKGSADKLQSSRSWIDPKQVSAWQIENGRLVTIQEKFTGNIGKHYFNRIMNDTMDEYYVMLNYLNPKEYEK